MSFENAQARIVTAPFTAWVAAPETAFPSLSTEEASFASGWFKLGESGDKNYSEAGVTVTHTQTVATFTGAGTTSPRKAWRTDEGLEIAFELADLNAEQYATILDDALVTHVTGTPGEKHFSLYKGPHVHLYSILIRGPSSEKESLHMQYNVPYVYQGANPAPKFALKGGPALLACNFIALETTNESFGEIKIGTES